MHHQKESQELSVTGWCSPLQGKGRLFAAEGEEVDPHLVVYVPPVQQQIGKDDCGAFAIAFAVHLLLGEKLEEVEFDQSQMRQHLLICFKERRFSAFPTK